MKKVFIQISLNSRQKTVSTPIFNKNTGSGPETLLKTSLGMGVFIWILETIMKNTYLVEHLRTVVSEITPLMKRLETAFENNSRFLVLPPIFQYVWSMQVQLRVFIG